MLIKTLRLAFMIVLLGVLSVLTTPSVSAFSGTCESSGQAFAYDYATSSLQGQSGPWTFGPVTLQDYATCLSDSQFFAINGCYVACGNAGASHGVHGVYYCAVNWSISWNTVHQGSPSQQYDCGDVF